MIEVSYQKTIPYSFYEVLSQYYDYEHIEHVHAKTLGRYEVLEVKREGDEVIFRHHWPVKASGRRETSTVRHTFEPPNAMTFEFAEGRYRGTRVRTTLSDLGNEGTRIDEIYGIPGVPNWPFLKPLVLRAIRPTIERIWKEDLDVEICHEGWPGIPASASAMKTRLDRARVSEDRSALAEGEARCVRVGETEVAVFCREGELHALENRCPHAGGPMALGEAGADGCVRCPWHGAAFELRTGAAVSGPVERDLQRFEATMVEGVLMVEADESA